MGKKVGFPDYATQITPTRSAKTYTAPSDGILCGGVNVNSSATDIRFSVNGKIVLRARTEYIPSGAGAFVFPYFIILSKGDIVTATPTAATVITDSTYFYPFKS